MPGTKWGWDQVPGIQGHTLETCYVGRQNTVLGSNPHIVPCVVSKSDRGHGTATTATGPARGFYSVFAVSTSP